MPGEDLESDDEYLNPVVDDDDDDDGDEEEESAPNEADESRTTSRSPPPVSMATTTRKKKKRKRNGSSSDGDIPQDAAAASEGEGHGHGDQGETETESKKGRAEPTAKTPRQLLFETARGIARRDAEIQAAFLWACFSHSLKMGGDALEGVDKFTADQFHHVGTSSSSPSSSPSSSRRQQKRQQQQRRDEFATFADFVRGGNAISSVKRLKKWKARGSPMIVVACLSARRAVAVLKDLASLNVRCAKLFPKHMNVEGQVAMLNDGAFGIAVGTPNRLLKLCEAESGGEGGGSALSLAQTELMVIDCHEDHKRFTVCTLNDTAPDLMRFLRVAVVPEMQKRKSIKFAMF